MVESREYAGLTEEQVRAERELLEGVPLLNLGAFLVPPVWGPGHGSWITILWYPLWLFADNMFYSAWKYPSAFTIGFGVLTFVILLVLTLLYARLMQPRALHRAIEEKGKTKEEYLRAERKWAVACAIIGVLFIAGATYYNVVIRTGL